jgi:hypothetical protein
MVARQPTVKFLQISTKDIRAKDEFLKGASTAGRSMRAHDSSPPEDGGEEAIIVLLLDESSARNVEIEIGVPPSNFGRLRVIRISQMGADNSQLWPVSSNQVKSRNPAPIKTYVRRLFRMQSIYDAGVKKKNS